MKQLQEIIKISCIRYNYYHQIYFLLLLTLFLEDSTGDEFKRGEDRPLLLKRGGMWRHGPWCDPTNVGMVPPAGYKKHRPAYPLEEHLRWWWNKKKQTLVKNRNKKQSRNYEKWRDGRTDGPV